MENKIQKALDRARVVGGIRPDRPSSAPIQIASNDAAAALHTHDPVRLVSHGGVPAFDQRLLAEHRIVHQGMADPRILNVFRDIATRLLQHGRSGGFVAMVTSVVPGGGGSLVALNCAVALSLIKGKALLIDGNLRTHGQAPDLAPAARIGLADFLDSTQIVPDDIVYETPVPGLLVVPAIGKDNPRLERNLSSTRMEVLLSTFRQRRRDLCVVLDAPPATELADIRALSQLCDYVLLVVPYAKVTEANVDDVRAAIPADKLLGVIFNEGVW